MYTFITFTSPAEAPREVENRLRLMENVLRFLVIRQDEDAAAPAKAEPAAVVVETPEEAPAPDAE